VPGNLLSLCLYQQTSRANRFHGQVETHRRFFCEQSLPDTLRSLGGYVDQEKGRLLRVANFNLLGPEIAYRIEFALPDAAEWRTLGRSQRSMRSLTLCANRGVTTRPRPEIGGMKQDGCVLTVR
jgi:hypothetical protein